MSLSSIASATRSTPSAAGYSFGAIYNGLAEELRADVKFIRALADREPQ